MRRGLLVMFLFSSFVLRSQDLRQKLDAAISKMEADEQFTHALISFHVEEAKGGTAVYDKNGNAGLAPASCQKLVTSVAAFELLGKTFSYTTSLYASGKIVNGILNGDLYVKGSGDPTFGSWRYNVTKENVVLRKFTEALNAAGIKGLTGKIYSDQQGWTNAIPDGWIWQDVGNYYGAAAYGLNWRENQYDLLLTSGNTIGDTVKISGVKPLMYNMRFRSELRTTPEGEGKDAYIYLPVGSDVTTIKGTIGINKNDLAVSGSMIDPANQFSKTLLAKLSAKTFDLNSSPVLEKPVPLNTMLIAAHISPQLDSINYFFLKRSVNLYGEAFVKTICKKEYGYASTDSGVAIIRRFWQRNGIEASALNIIDGSGLSPGNRVTTKALVKILAYAKNKPWFKVFEEALPEIHDIKMKDGYINCVRSFSGYITSKSGKEYIFSFIVNNFDGSAHDVSQKMWKVLDILKL